jgi:hypothetical protein
MLQSEVRHWARRLDWALGVALLICCLALGQCVRLALWVLR